MPAREASAVWEGSIREGHGTMKMASGSYSGPYTWSSRFEEATGTNPEELIAAAHAGCFTMALSFALARAGFNEGSLETNAAVKLEQVDGGFTVTRSVGRPPRLVCSTRVPFGTRMVIAEASMRRRDHLAGIRWCRLIR